MQLFKALHSVSLGLGPGFTFIGKRVHLPLVFCSASFFAFPVRFVLKQVSRWAVFLLWRIIQFKQALCLLSSFPSMVWIFSSPGCLRLSGVKFWSPESVAEMSWFASAQDQGPFLFFRQGDLSEHCDLT